VLDRDFGTGMRVLASWLHGTIAQPTWPQLAIVAFMLAIGLAGSVPLARSLNTLALGEEYATHLGLSVQQVRIALQRRSEPKKLRHALRGDLDWILLKALDKDRARRYSAPSVFSSAIWPSVAQWSAAGDSATPSASPAAR